MNTDPLIAWVIQLILLTVRISVFFVVSPLLGRTAIPSLAKIGLSLCSALILVNLFPPPDVSPYTNIAMLAGAVVREAFVGLGMGFVNLIFFTFVYTTGNLIDMQIGFSMSQVFDASIGGQSSVSASLLNVVFMLSFVFSDGVTKLLFALGQSFTVVPVGEGIFPQAAAALALDLFIKTFALSIQVAMPVLASSLLTEVALGVVVRTAPQMNIFVIGIPLKVIVGLVVFSVSIGVITNTAGGIFDSMFHALDDMVTHFAPTQT